MTSDLDVVRGLIAIEFDAYGTPRSKLPNCPQCDHDELTARFVAAGLVVWICLLCNWRFEHTRLA